MSANPTNGGREDAIRLALLQERLGVLIEANKAWELDAKAWRQDVTTALSANAQQLAKITERLESVEEEVGELRRQIHAKVGVVYFQGMWKVLVGVGAIIAMMGSFLTILKTLGVIH